MTNGLDLIGRDDGRAIWHKETGRWWQRLAPTIGAKTDRRQSPLVLGIKCEEGCRPRAGRGLDAAVLGSCRARLPSCMQTTGGCRRGHPGNHQASSTSKLGLAGAKLEATKSEDSGGGLRNRLGPRASMEQNGELWLAGCRGQASDRLGGLKQGLVGGDRVLAAFHAWPQPSVMRRCLPREGAWNMPVRRVFGAR